MSNLAKFKFCDQIPPNLIIKDQLLDILIFN